MAKKQTPGEEKYKPITLKMFPSLIAEVDEIRKQQGDISRNAWIRQAIIEKIRRDKQEE